MGLIQNHTYLPKIGLFMKWLMSLWARKFSFFSLCSNRQSFEHRQWFRASIPIKTAKAYSICKYTNSLSPECTFVNKNNDFGNGFFPCSILHASHLNVLRLCQFLMNSPFTKSRYRSIDTCVIFMGGRDIEKYNKIEMPNMWMNQFEYNIL